MTLEEQMNHIISVLDDSLRIIQETNEGLRTDLTVLRAECIVRGIEVDEKGGKIQ